MKQNDDKHWYYIELWDIYHWLTLMSSTLSTFFFSNKHYFIIEFRELQINKNSNGSNN